MNNPLLIIPTYISKPHHAEVLKTCLKTLRKTTNKDIFVIDDGSPDRETSGQLWNDLVGVDNFALKLKEENTGFASTVNVGLQRALEQKRDAVLVNADIEFAEIGWLETMAATEANLVGALLLYPNMLIQHAGIYFSAITRAFEHRFVGSPPNLPSAEVECKCPVTGALQYIKYELLEDVGIYDDDFFLGYEDVDYCIRAISAGHTSVYNPKVKAIHHESLFRGGSHSDQQKESYRTLVKKHSDKNFYGLAPNMMMREDIV